MFPFKEFSRIQPHARVQEIACDALSADVNLVALGPGDTPVRPVRTIHVITAGAGLLRVKFVDGTFANLTGLVDGRTIEPTPCDVVAIIDDANTDCTLVRVGW